MLVKADLLSALRSLDQKLADRYLRLLGDRSSLIVLLFHSLFRDAAEIAADRIAPQQKITVEHFRRIIEYFQTSGYEFVSPARVLEGLNAGGRYVMLTFDDGYFNNTRALPALIEFGVPAAFFISACHVLEQKLFWWDVLHREAAARGLPANAVHKLKSSLKQRRTEDIEGVIAARFGTASFAPTSDTDRPMTWQELRDFARSPWVHVGNHTANHAILTNYSPPEIRSQIRTCQAELQWIVGRAPVALSYPNGNWSSLVVEIARQEGLRMGITAVTRKNRLPLSFDGTNGMRLGRMVPYGSRSLESQCDLFRSEIGVYRLVKSPFDRMRWR